VLFFFFQAEDGIRDRNVTGVQTCALPICEIHFSVRGNGFLQHMVRIIVGTLLEVGCGKILVNELAPILAAKDRQAAGITIPPEGLYLWNVNYEKETDNA